MGEAFFPIREGAWNTATGSNRNAGERSPGRRSDYVRLLYFDTVTHSLPALKYLIKTAGIDKVLMGSDYPFEVNDPDPVETVRRLQSIPFEGKRKIWGENAAGLLGISGTQN